MKLCPFTLRSYCLLDAGHLNSITLNTLLTMICLILFSLANSGGRLRHPAFPSPMMAAVAAAAAAHQANPAGVPIPQLLPMAGPFPGYPDPRMAAPMPHGPVGGGGGAPGGGGLIFSQEDVDTVLYGYAKHKAVDQLSGHALSGLRIGELSHGRGLPRSTYTYIAFQMVWHFNGDMLRYKLFAPILHCCR